MRVEVHCKCGKVYVLGEGEGSGEGYLPLPPGEHYDSETCSSCRPDLDTANTGINANPDMEYSKDKFKE